MWELDYKESWAPKTWCFLTVVLEKTLENPLDCKEIQPVHPKGDQSWVFIGRTDGWSWNSNTLATWCEELTHLKRPWCWERLRVKVEWDDRGWDDWMASLTQWTWVWVNSRSWWWTGRPGVLWFMRSQRVGHDWATELNCSIFWSHKQCSRVPISPHLHQHLYLFFSDSIFLTSVRKYCLVVLISISLLLWWLVIWNIFSYICWPSIITSGETSIQVLWPLLNQVIWCFLLSCRLSLCILDINPLSDIWFANIFSQSVGCPSTVVSLHAQVLEFDVGPICLVSLLWLSCSFYFLSMSLSARVSSSPLPLV